MSIKGRLNTLWSRFITEPVRASEEESLEYLNAHRGRIDWKSLIVCVVVAFNLTLLQYFGMSNRMGWFVDALAAVGLDGVAQSLTDAMQPGTGSRLGALLYWVGSCVVCYFVIPALVVKLVFRQKLTDYGMGIKGALAHYKVYLVLFLGILPLVVAVSFNPAFQDQYPFFKSYGDAAIPAGFLIWELAYALQFFALEFFFRGFMVHGLKHRLGALSVVVMAVPYCMIHFGKPFPETIGAIFAGLILGMLSLRTKSIWLGVWIHVSVAWTMDFLALWHKDLLPW